MRAPGPDPAADLPDAVVGFLEFVHTTVVNKLHGLEEEQARATPLASSPAMSALGLVKHFTAVQRQHVQLHIGGAELPPTWRHDDLTFDFRVGPQGTIESVFAAFDAEWARSRRPLAAADWRRPCGCTGIRCGSGRLLVDALQESGRHLGHLDVVRELLGGAPASDTAMRFVRRERTGRTEYRPPAQY